MGASFTTTVQVLSPEYFRGFRCKCGECRSVCCRGWRITLSEEEYFRLMGLRCSPSLRASLDAAFDVFEEPSPGRYAYIAPGPDGCCRVMDSDGWCSLHRECGEGVQPAVCRLYPRSIKPGEVTEACCSGSCEAVVERLMAAHTPLRFVTETLSVSAPLPPGEAEDESRITRRRRCMALWQQPGDPLPVRLFRIGEFLGVREEPDDRLLLTRAAELLCTLGARSPSLAAAADPVIAELGIAGTVDEAAFARFADGERSARARLPQREQWLGNVIANHMFYVQFPYAGEGTAPAAAYDGLYACYAILRVTTARAAGEDAFADTAAAVLRCIEHTDFYHNAHIVLRGRKSLPRENP